MLQGHLTLKKMVLGVERKSMCNSHNKKTIVHQQTACSTSYPNTTIITSANTFTTTVIVTATTTSTTASITIITTTINDTTTGFTSITHTTKCTICKVLFKPAIQNACKNYGVIILFLPSGVVLWRLHGGGSLLPCGPS